MGRTNATHNSDWRDGFLFVGNHLILDFLNTCPVQDGETRELLTDFSALLRWFQAAGLITFRQAAKLKQQWGESVRARQIVDSMCELREKLKKEIFTWEGSGTVHRPAMEELNRLMAQHPMRTRLRTNESASAIELWFEPSQPEDLLAPLAHGAATLFANVDHLRVRKCGQCVLHFYDTSKKGTRRWCSMRLCGNRFKVAAYAARQRLPTPG